MNYKVKVVLLVSSLLFFGVNFVKAEEPKTIKMPTLSSKPQVEITQGSNSTTGEDNVVEQELNFYDLELSRLGGGLLIEADGPKDSISTNEVEIYFQMMLPIIRKEDLKNIELIEVL
jgi:hypothetical protein